MIRFVLILICGFFGGIYYVYHGLTRYLLFQKAHNTATTKVRSAALGLVELCGQGRSKNNMKSPISQLPCVHWRIIAQYYQSGKHGGWRKIFEKRSDDPFFLYDDTGEIMVNPSNAEIDIKHDTIYQGYISGKGFFGMEHKKMPDNVLQFINSLGPEDKKKMLSHDREDVRIFEYCMLQDSDQIYVLGTAELIEDAGSSSGNENLVVKRIEIC